ncbi:anion transporter [Nocardiopsis gilva YIM 90087]|uniref:Sodium-dependent dicarboxylate transporter SdcS n=1 Tax=Nocardiopsis gilva YIM 90087 TaxID=1235441 RepID=A0A223S1W1_9ACTN|nr:DASS family sodium-coupled anion symporter [Nocardiopsis gilva]ASU82098.1 anion transporter [Nocardiopsis gilva YIM 90087]
MAADIGNNPPADPSRQGLPALTTERAANPQPSKAKRVGLALAPLLAAAVYLLLPDALSTGGKATAAVAVLMATLWATEALPIPVTALLPLVLFPLFGVAEIDDVAAPYANDVIFLFMGGFMLALAMQKANLHKRVALAIVGAVGTNPVRLIGGFMLASGFITMWVANTATTIMMLPIALSVITLVTQLRDGKSDTNFATALLLGVAYAASIGSVATLIGTPPNALMAGYVKDTFDINVGFGQWMLIGFPLAAVFLVIAWVVLTRVVFPPKVASLDGAQDVIKGELRDMGPMTSAERRVLAVFVAAAASWVFIPLLAQSPTGGMLPWLDRISDSGIAMAVAVALFLIPNEGTQGEKLMDWESAVRLPWGILLLFGGGLTLSSQFTANGLSEWIGTRVGALDDIPVWVLLVVVIALVLVLTELTSNTATTATFLPVLGGVALGMNLDVMTLVVPATLAASLAFMLPVATPPNAVVFGSGQVTIPQMIKAGTWLNTIAVFVVMFVMYAIAGWLFGISF